MTIEEFTKKFYPNEKEIEKIALKTFIDKYGIACGKSIGDRVTNTLLRGGIASIKDLHDASYEDLISLNRIGSRSIDVILRLKNVINENLYNEES